MSRMVRLAGLCLVMIVAAVARAQSTFGSIRGTVQDATGGVIPNANVTVRSSELNVTQQGTTDAGGEFRFDNLQPGHYTVVVEVQGFAKATVSNAQLDARQELRVPVTLSVASQSTEVTVEATGVAMNTENATVGDTLSNSEATQLPMNARAVSSSPLASLAISQSVVTDSQGNIAVGGATSAQTGFSVDGISTANVRSNGALKDAYPSSEGIAETKVTAFNNNAEFAQIGDVTFTTKSGTTSWHGSAFEYFQNAAMDATVYGFTSKAPKNFNAFGGSVGGPVIGLHNKTFFFADYEGNRKTQSTPELLLVPTSAERSGSMNPVAAALLAFYPLPNANGNGYNYQALVPIPASTDGWDVRIDQILTAKQSLYARFSWKDLQISSGGSGLTANQFLPNVMAQDQNRSLLVSHNYMLTKKLVNEARFGFTNFNENDAFPIQGSAAIAQLGLQGIDISAHPTGQAFPEFSFSDGSISNIGQDRTGQTISETMEFTDNLTWSLGKHTAKFGMDVRHVRYNALMFFQPSDDYGDFIFSGQYTGTGIGDLIAGLPQESFFAITSPQINATSTQWGVYAQDEWQMNSKLTLSFGVRWELLPPFVESQGDLGSFDAATNSVLVPDSFVASKTQSANPAFQTVYANFLKSFNFSQNCGTASAGLTVSCSNLRTASQDGVSQGLRQIYKADFDPRISVAYRPFRSGNTVVRAGFGIFTQTTLGPMSFNNAGNPTSNLITNINTQPGQAGFFQFPQTSPCALSSACTTAGGGSLEQANDPHFRDPQAAQWNLTIERQLTPKTLLRASYVGMANYRLPVTVDLNQIHASTTPWDTGATAGQFVDIRAPYQNWTLLMSSENYGHASYQAGVLEASQRLSHGLSYQASYTWAKNISDAQGSDAPTAFSGEESYAAELADRFNLKSDRGNVVATPRHRAVISGTYQLPFGAGRKWSGPAAVNAVLGGWDVSTVTTLQTGDWLTPTISSTGCNYGTLICSGANAPINDQSNTGMAVRSGGGAMLRPDCGAASYYGGSGGAYFNLAAFQPTPIGAGRFGNCGVGILQGPGMANVNAGLAKTVSLHDRFKLRLEATFTNVLNHSNFAPPQTNVSNAATFGQLTSVLPQGSGGNRTGQLAARLDF